MKHALPVVALVLSGAAALFLGVEGLRAEAQGPSARESSPGLARGADAVGDVDTDSATQAAEREPATEADGDSATQAAEREPATEARAEPAPADDADAPSVAPAAPAASVGDGGCAPLNFYYRRGSAWPYERPDGESLGRFRALLDEHPEARLVVAGHADQSGARERNLDLSYRRAQRVFVELGEAGFPAHRVMLQAAGDFVPVEGADRRAAVNRRVEVTIRGLPAGTCEGEE